MADDASRAVEGGPASPVFITNSSLPGSAPTGTQNVALLSSPTGASATQVQGVAAHDAPVVGNPLLLGGYASSTPPANVTVADIVRLWVGLNGTLKTDFAYSLNSTDDAIQAFPPSTASTVATTAYAASLVAKAAPGTLVSLSVYNSALTPLFVQLHNTTSVPADGVAPVLSLTVATVVNLVLNFPLTGMPFTTGITVVGSTTGPTKTLATAVLYITAVIL